MWGAATLGLFCVRFFLHKRSGPICVSSRGESVTEIHISNSMYVFYISVVADGSRYFCDLEGGYIRNRMFVAWVSPGMIFQFIISAFIVCETLSIPTVQRNS